MGKSFKKGKAEFGFISFNGVLIALTSDYSLVEDYEFDGIVTDVVKAEGIDEENHEYDIFWRPKHSKMENGKLKGNINKGAFDFLDPLTCKRNDWVMVK